MEPIFTQVECYSGYKADERPRRFLYYEAWLEVGEVVDSRHQVGRSSEGWRADYFKVRAEDGHLYLLKHDLEADQWLLMRRW